MIMVPLGFAEKALQRSVVGWVLGVVLLYQLLLFKLLGVHPPDAGLIVGGDLRALETWQAIGLSLFRGSGPMATLMMLSFWLVIGAGMEKRMGPALPAATHLVGGLVMLVLVREEVGLVRWDRNASLALGGTLACIGLALQRVPLVDVKFFYLMGSLTGVLTGRSTTAAVVVIIPVWVLLALTQVVPYTKAEQIPPGDLGVFLFSLLFPLAAGGGLGIVSKFSLMISGGKPSAVGAS